MLPQLPTALVAGDAARVQVVWAAVGQVHAEVSQVRRVLTDVELMESNRSAES